MWILPVLIPQANISFAEYGLPLTESVDVIPVKTLLTPSGLAESDPSNSLH